MESYSISAPTTNTSLSEKNKYRDIEVIAFIRFASDEITLKTCLESLSPAIKKGVLAYHKRCIYDDPAQNTYLAKEDKALEYALEFCKKNPGFRVAYYPHIIYPLYDKQYDNNQRPFENTLAAFYEFTRLECLKIAETDVPYLYKVDTDQIYDSGTIQNQIDILNTSEIEYDLVFLCKYNVHYCPFDDELYFVSLLDSQDHFIFKGKEFTFDNKLINNKMYEVITTLSKSSLDSTLSSKENSKTSFISKLFRKTDDFDETQRYLKLPTFATEAEYLTAKAKNPKLDLAIYQAKKNEYLQNTSRKILIYPKSFSSFAHFIFVNKALDNFIEVVPGYPSEIYKKKYNLVPYKEFYNSEQFLRFCEQFPELKRDFYKEENIKAIAKKFNFDKYKNSIEAYKALKSHK